MLFTILILLAIAVAIYLARKSFASPVPSQPEQGGAADGDPKDGIDRNDRR